MRLMTYLSFLGKKDFYTRVLPHPGIILSSVYYSLFYLARNPDWVKVDSQVKGMISLPVAIFLYRSILKYKNHPSPNIVEVGAYKGKSTIFLSLAARESGKRIKSFELFSGLPTADPDLDSAFYKGELITSVEEYESNVKTYGKRDLVDLTIGDARETMLPVLGKAGFSVAFLDVDVYEVMRELLNQLLSIARGGEVIFIHDTFSPGVLKAIEESISLSSHTIRRTEPTYDTAKLEVIQAAVKRPVEIVNVSG